MKSTVYYSKRKFSDEYKASEKPPVFDFTELLKVWK